MGKFLTEARKINTEEALHDSLSGVSLVVWSEALEEKVVILFDDTGVNLKQGTVVYKEDELRKIVRFNLTKEALRDLHEIKKVFSSAVLHDFQREKVSME